MTTTDTFKHKLTNRIAQYKFNNNNNNGHGGDPDNKFYTCDEVSDEIINLFDAALTDLVVEERVNRRSICTRTIRKIREQILYLKTEEEEDDDGAEKVSPEPSN